MSHLMGLLPAMPLEAAAAFKWSYDIYTTVQIEP